MKGRVLEAHLNTERGVASRGSDTQPPPREARDPARRALRPGREELAVTDPEAIPVREARDRSPKSPRWSAGRRASPVWDARRLARRLACRVTCRPNGCLASTRRLSALRHPSIGVAKPKFQNPGAKNAPRERGRLFDERLPQVDGGGAKKQRREPSGRLQRQNSPSGEGCASENGIASCWTGPMPASGL